MFEDFIENVAGVRTVKLDSLIYICNRVALLDREQVKKRYFRHDEEFSSPEHILYMPYERYLQQIGLSVHYVPVRAIEEEPMKRTLREERTIIVTPEARNYIKHLQCYGSDKELVMITHKPRKSVSLVQLLTRKESGMPRLRWENYQFTHEDEPIISNSIVDSKTSRFLFEPSEKRHRLNYERMLDFFKKYLVSEFGYKVILQQLNEELTLTQIQNRQELIQSFADMGVNNIESLGEKIKALDGTATAIRELTKPMTGIMQHFRGKHGWHYEFIGEEFSYACVMGALRQVCVVPPDLEFPNYDDVNLIKVRRGINDVTSPENPNGFQPFVKYAERILERSPENFVELIELLRRSEGDKRPYDGTARFRHAAAYMKRALAWLDSHRTLAEIVLKEGWTFPKIVPRKSEVIDIRDGFYPFMQVDHPIVRNSTYLNRNTRVELVSGSNMNGKTVYLMQVPTIAIFGHVGFPVPASSTKMSKMDKIIVRMKKRGEVEHNESALGAEVNELTELLNSIQHDGRHTLISLDEYLTSTDPRQGEALLYGIIKERILSSSAKMLASHHFPHLNELAEEFPVVTSSGFIPDREGEIVKMNYRKTPNVIHTESYGVEVAHQMGLPKDVIDTAKKRLEKLNHAT